MASSESESTDAFSCIGDGMARLCLHLMLLFKGVLYEEGRSFAVIEEEGWNAETANGETKSAPAIMIVLPHGLGLTDTILEEANIHH